MAHKGLWVRKGQYGEHGTKGPHMRPLYCGPMGPKWDTLVGPYGVGPKGPYGPPHGEALWGPFIRPMGPKGPANSVFQGVDPYQTCIKQTNEKMIYIYIYIYVYIYIYIYICVGERVGWWEGTPQEISGPNLGPCWALLDSFGQCFCPCWAH
jgi:hypothetical protein